MFGAATKMALKSGAKKMAKGAVVAGKGAVVAGKGAAKNCLSDPDKCRGQALGVAQTIGEVKGALKGPPTAAPSTGNNTQAAAIGRAIMAAGGTTKSTAMSKGGVVRKGGRYYLHKGEKVVSKRSVPKVTKAMQKAGMTLRHKGKAAVKKVPFIPMNKIRNMANGGTILKTGLHLLKPGQRVIPASKAAKARKAIKAAKK